MVLFFTFSCNSKYPNDEKTNFSIEILNLYFGRVESITLLTNDSIKSEIGKTKGKEKKIARKLEDREKEKIGIFVKNFPLKGLKNQYVNENIEDGIQMKFIIRIDDFQKTIYTSNEYQDDLGKLVKKVVSLLPEDYIGYNKDALSR